jgi:hypothetical protein
MSNRSNVPFPWSTYEESNISTISWIFSIYAVPEENLVFRRRILFMILILQNTTNKNADSYILISSSNTPVPGRSRVVRIRLRNTSYQNDESEVCFIGILNSKCELKLFQVHIKALKWGFVPPTCKNLRRNSSFKTVKLGKQNFFTQISQT